MPNQKPAQKKSAKPGRKQKRGRKVKRQSGGIRLHPNQSKTLPLTMRARSSLAARGTDEVMRCITLPRETKAIRFPQAGDVQKTAVFRLYSEGYFEHDAGNTNSTCFFLSPSPIHPLWTERKPVSIDFIVAGFQAVVQSGLSAAVNLPNIQLVSYSVSKDAPFPGLPRTYASNKNQNCSIYIPQGATAKMSFTVAGGTGTINIGFRMWTNADDNALYNAQVPVTTAGGSVTLTQSVQDGGWLDIVNWNGTAGLFTPLQTLSVIVQLDITKRYLMPAFPSCLSATELQAVRTAARVTANSVLFTNTSANVQRGGTLFGARINALAKPTNNVWKITDMVPNISQVNRVNKWRGEGLLGLYTYTVPCVSSHKFSNYVEIEGSTAAYFYSLEDTDYVNAGYYVGSTTTVYAPGTSNQQFTWQYDEHLEGISDSPVFTLGVPSISLDKYQNALTAASARTPFTENPRHLALLGAAARALIRPSVPALRGHMANLYLGADRALENL